MITVFEFGKLYSVVNIYRGKYSLKLSKNKKLIRLIDLWLSSSIDMKPGRFISKVTGRKCSDMGKIQ